MVGRGPVDQLVQHAAELTLDEAADLYRAYAAHILIQGSDAERQALARARARAARSQRLDEYEHARHAAAAAWRTALPFTSGPWLAVGRAIANAGPWSSSRAWTIGRTRCCTDHGVRRSAR